MCAKPYLYIYSVCCLVLLFKNSSMFLVELLLLFVVFHFVLSFLSINCQTEGNRIGHANIEQPNEMVSLHRRNKEEMHSKLRVISFRSFSNNFFFF